MLDVTYGVTRRRTFSKQVAEVLQSMDLEGSLYLGYPVFATADDQVTVDALLVSKQHGLIILSLSEEPPAAGDEEGWQQLRDDLDRLYVAVETNLGRNEDLRAGRRLAVLPSTVAVFPTLDDAPAGGEAFFTDIRNLAGTIDAFDALDEAYYKPLQAALQRVSTIKPRKRRAKAKTPESRGSVLKEVEKEIANLDKLQKQAAIESPEGPQRIRGLAGSGKTIVLALKAAYLHAQHPEWIIAVTFSTRSLYQQFEDLILTLLFRTNQ